MKDAGKSKRPSCGFVSVSLPATKDLTNIYEGFLEDWESLVSSHQSRSYNLLAIPKTLSWAKTEKNSEIGSCQAVRCPCKDANGTRMEKTGWSLRPTLLHSSLTHSISFAFTVSCSPTHLSITKQEFMLGLQQCSGLVVTLTCLFHMLGPRSQAWVGDIRVGVHHYVLVEDGVLARVLTAERRCCHTACSSYFTSCFSNSVPFLSDVWWELRN